jgi:predicted acyltransferase
LKLSIPEELDVGNWFEEIEEFHVTRPRDPGEGRVLSVDALRGFDMFWIIGGKKIFKGLDDALDLPLTNWLFSQLDHAEWYGFTFYDVIMPLFLFLVGISMTYSVRKRLIAEPSRVILWKHVAVRLVLLWILGMAVQGKLLTYDIGQIKLYSNTLQAIAAGYLLASIIVLYLPVVHQISATVGLMLVFWAAFLWIPVPGFGAGFYLPDGNIAIYIDKMILGGFQDGTTYTWILSSLNFGATTMLGVFAGYMLQSRKKPAQKLWRLAVIGIVLVLAGLLWSLWHPLIKHLWTGSFVLFSGGLCFLLLAGFFGVIEVMQFRTWSFPLVVIGSNAILAYVSANIFDYRLVAKVFVGGLEQYVGDWYPFVLAAGGFTVLYLVLLYLYRNRILIKI